MFIAAVLAAIAVAVFVAYKTRSGANGKVTRDEVATANPLVYDGADKAGRRRSPFAKSLATHRGAKNGDAAAPEVPMVLRPITRPRPPPAPPQPDRREAAATTPTSGTANDKLPNDRPDATIDLLKLINPQRDGVEGRWQMEGGRLVFPVARLARLQVPCDVPDEYTLTAVVECQVKHDLFLIGLIVSGVQMTVIIDGWSMTTSGIDLLDGKTFEFNETTKKGHFLVGDVPNTIVCIVRKGALQVSCNGSPLIDWSGDCRPGGRFVVESAALSAAFHRLVCNALSSGQIGAGTRLPARRAVGGGTARRETGARRERQ